MEYKKDKNIDTIIRDSVFFGNNLVYFIFKRTQKISKAVYLISEIIKDTEPLKFTLRTVASGMMNYGDLKDIRGFGRDVAVNINSLKSLVLLANFSKNISDMNTSVIVRECDEVLLSLADLDFTGKQYLALDKTFFDTVKDEADSPFISIIQDEKNNTQINRNYKGHIKDKGMDMSFINSIRMPQERLTGSESRSDVIKDTSRSDRKKQILNIINSMKEVTIKDISNQIKDCSEKTIQRELIGLLSEGSIKRTGDRRWSKYSLNISA